MIKLIFNLFKKQMIAFAFATQRKQKGFEGLEWCFMDSVGNNYYKYIDDMDMPIERKAQLERYLIELDAKLSRREVKMFVDAMKAKIEEIINSPQKGKITGLASLALMVEEIERREEMILHPELLMDIASVTYIRHDELPQTFDEDIHRQKVTQFNLDAKGGLYDFFYQGGLSAYMPTFKELQKDFPKYIKEAETMMRQTDKFLISILGEESLKNENKTTNS